MDADDRAPTPPVESTLRRREFLAVCSAAGVLLAARPSTAADLEETVERLSPSPLAGALLGGEPITNGMVEEAAALIGLSFTEPEIELMKSGLEEQRESYRAIREAAPGNTVPPALAFDPLLPGRGTPAPPRTRDESARPVALPEVARPERFDEVAFWSLPALASLLRSGGATSVELTELYLERLERLGSVLECVVTLTSDRAIDAARRADAELAAGEWRGPLHGIPWGAKDLLSARGYPTTWGARPYAEQVIDEDAAVVARLEEAGAVLVAKLTLGALAWGDVWYGGMTRNPWKLEQGSSGSSAGSAAATVAGLVGFSIGSETWGSIVSPCTRTGATGLRPTFGRVSRDGAMALSWSMDKLGPICRSVEGCALVFDAIHGADGRDPAARDAPFDWHPDAPLSSIRVGYLASAFEEDHPTKAFDDAALEVLRGLGVDPVPIELPDEPPADPLAIILSAEAAAAFDQLTRSDRDDELIRQIENAWPNVFRQARTIPAVEYVQANRIRTRLMAAMESALSDVDVFVAPSFADDLLLITNLTGHPCVVVPNGFRDDGTPVSLSFVGNLYRDDAALLLAHRYQRASDYHLRRPAKFT
ncbi:MAG: amidase [Gemmatimonadota bacterium]|nr:amidase [Gemmatimonadota bacterium]